MRKGQGQGSALLHHVETHLQTLGARVLIIETSSLDNYDLTRACYAKHRYAEVARIPEFYGAREDKVLFWRKLSGRTTALC